MTARVVPFGSVEQALTVELRRQVLRLPIGLDFTVEELAKEQDDVHLAVFDVDEPVACLILTPKSSTTLKMRQVAVRVDQQGRGVGRVLVGASESWARENAFDTIALNARETAVPFYLALGYSIDGEPFEEVGLPHRAMFKKL